MVNAARASLPLDGSLTTQSIADICAQAGLNAGAFRQLFPSDQALLDAVHEVLVDECVQRLRSGVDRFATDATDSSDESAIARAAVAIARSSPLDRTSLIIRSQRRVASLRSAAGMVEVAEGERMFITALAGVFADLFEKLHRRISWPTELAVRVILNTYERSFETWLLRGADETHFFESGYVRKTLPTILAQVSAAA
ncbi:hypothetical protein G3T36_03845 [Diaminobutyricibacter tongyongensis]|uniref:TetR/AcrR family transcriptional regulator n=1 Tax=Leifsonia tongyongensis TaxID=1268043 RepID=A0A6L9XUL7_9MICO|nr:hypothetical protein [Diaminobutyricibacter tongyongensis]NEN04996.1 hypothetical protein [Diaminobutyricibacter tongyongensis]